MIVDLSFIPVRNGEPVDTVIRVIHELGLNYRPTPMGTTLEIENFEELGKLLEKIRREVLGLDRKVHLCCQSII